MVSGFRLNINVRSDSGIKVLIINSDKIDRLRLMAHTDRSKDKIKIKLIINIRVIDGIIKLNVDGSNEEKISGIITKYRQISISRFEGE